MVRVLFAQLLAGILLGAVSTTSPALAAEIALTSFAPHQAAESGGVFEMGLAGAVRHVGSGLICPASLGKSALASLTTLKAEPGRSDPRAHAACHYEGLRVRFAEAAFSDVVETAQHLALLEGRSGWQGWPVNQVPVDYADNRVSLIRGLRDGARLGDLWVAHHVAADGSRWEILVEPAGDRRQADALARAALAEVASIPSGAAGEVRADASGQLAWADPKNPSTSPLLHLSTGARCPEGPEGFVQQALQVNETGLFCRYGSGKAVLSVSGRAALGQPELASELQRLQTIPGAQLDGPALPIPGIKEAFAQSAIANIMGERRHLLFAVAEGSNRRVNLTAISATLEPLLAPGQLEAMLAQALGPPPS